MEEAVQLSLFDTPVNGGVVFEDPGSAALTAELERRSIALSAVLGRYDVVEANQEHGYIIMAEPGANKSFAVQSNVAPAAATAELGSAAPSPWTAWTREEHVADLRDRQGLTKFYRMKRNDGIVQGSLRALKTPLLSAHWYVKPGSDSARDKRIAEFVQNNLFNDLNVSWFTLLNDILLCCDYGYMPFEKVYDPPTLEGNRFVQRLRKLAPRHAMDVQKWHYDSNGGPNGITMESNMDTPHDPGVFIPIEKMVIFSLEPEAGDLKGISVLRSAYKHWFFKDTLYKIDAIQKERHGVGIPVIKLPMNWNNDDKKAAENLGRNLRTNERAHIILPPNWDVYFARVEGQLVDCMKSIEHHDMAIMANVLGSFLKDPSVKSDSIDMFLKSTRYVAMTITDLINRFVIRELVDLNFRLGPSRKYPTLQARRIGEWEDLRTQSFTLRNLVGAGIIEPDDELEKTMRDELDLPIKDSATARKHITEPAAGLEEETDEDPQRQRGQVAGRPRQQPSPPVGSGRGNSGTDRSGG